MFDTGIFHHLTNINSFDELQGNSLLGVSWEGFVIEQIKQVLPIGYEMFFYRTHEGTELDLVITKGNKPFIGIEIKYTSSPSITKSMKIAMDDLGTKKNFIIIPGNERFELSKEVVVIGLNNFLSESI